MSHSTNARPQAKKHWRSLAELEQSPEFLAALKKEFPGEDPDKLPASSRRRFLQVMGSSVALASATACRWKQEKILPMKDRPDGRIPGNPEYFATSIEIGGVASGLLVTCYEGRPTKVEGNPDHPASNGASGPFEQAAVLELYDPERSRSPVNRHGDHEHQESWEEVAGEFGSLLESLRLQRGAGLRILAEASSSRSLGVARERLLQTLPQAKWITYEPLAGEGERRGAEIAFGKAVRTHYELAEARTIVCLDADLLGAHPDALRHAREFAKGRDPKGEMNRLWAVEANFTPTGSSADHRLPLRSEQIKPFLLALEAEVGKKVAASGALAPKRTAKREGFLADEKVARFLTVLAEELAGHRGHSAIAVGARQPAEVHAVAHRLNALLGNVGKAVRYTELPRETGGSLGELVQEMKGGAVQTLLIFGGNPVYDAPVDLGFAEALAKVPQSIHLSLYRDETSRACSWHLPRAHALESWGDARAWDGTITLRQPLIDPLHGGRSPLEVLALVLGDGATSDRERIQRALGLDDAAFRKALHDGFVAGSAATVADVAPVAFDEGEVAASAFSAAPSGTLEANFFGSASTYDGRFANNGWLQELPDHLTRITWDNAALLAPSTAAELGLKVGDLVNIELDGKQLQMATYVLPGQAPGTVGLELGFGRKAAGVVGGDEAAGVESAGFDTYGLRTSNAPWFRSGARLTKAGGTYLLALTQDHHLIDAIGQQGVQERIGQLAREATHEEYHHHPDFAKHVVHHPELRSLWEEPKYEGARWGMTIDLNSCIGCNGCTVACQAENNIPVVGKIEVSRGRSMHWIRIDRYFSGEADDPQVVTQPVTCQQCENAPCEQVCPVAATVHSSEGLNDMVYNRCVGTRYCANNCPYKVRRFNYFDYNAKTDDPGSEIANMVYNPEVSLRWRGVMEKCTFCVQRIQHAKIAAGNEKRPVRDGEITTACAQACPTQAIVFGDLADPESRVSKLKADPRSYEMLSELNVKPRLSYLAKIRNPNPALATA